jgi:hypothetical protein
VALAASALIVLAAASAASPSRLDQLVEANVLGTHAFQIGLARKAGTSDPGLLSTRRTRRATPRWPHSKRTRRRS